MTVLERIAGIWFALLDASASAAAAVSARVTAGKRVRVVEDGSGGMTVALVTRRGSSGTVRVAAGDDAPASLQRTLRRSRVMLDLDPRRFVFRAIDVPARATEFIEQIVRTQIDRLTPWRSETVMFGWADPETSEKEGNVTVAVAATDRVLVAPILTSLERLGAAEILARVTLPADLQPAGAASRAVVVARRTAPALSVSVWRRVLGAATAVVVCLVIASSLYGLVSSIQLGAEAEDLARDGAAKRARLARALTEADPGAGPRLAIERRKAEQPFATLVLEAVSRLLPDDSYLLSLDLSGTRLQLVGFSNDAPALIRLFEGSEMFGNASFFAPTTRLANDPADRFSIEATVRPGAFQR